MVIGSLGETGDVSGGVPAGVDEHPADAGGGAVAGPVRPGGWVHLDGVRRAGRWPRWVSGGAEGVAVNGGHWGGG